MSETVVTNEFMLQMREKSRVYTLALVSRGPGWGRPDRDSIIWEHGRRNHALRLDKVLAIVGPTPDEAPLSGLYVFTKTIDEVTELMREDPAVQAGVFVFEVHPFVGFPGDALP
jgi:YCII-related domain-containing protein